MNKGILIAFCVLTVSLLLTEAYILEKRSVDRESAIKKTHVVLDKKFAAKNPKIKDALRLDSEPDVKFAKIQNVMQEAHKQAQIQTN